MRILDIEQAILEYSIPEPNSGCNIWLGSISSDGYPKFGSGGGIRVHRYVCEKIHGPIGELYACHKCNNVFCIEENHLYPGTPLDNMRDAQIRGTFANIHKARDEFWESKDRKERLEILAPTREGARKFFDKMTPEQRSEYGRRAALARWSK